MGTDRIEFERLLNSIADTELVESNFPLAPVSSTGRDYSYRKDWLEKRMLELCDIFSVDIYAFTILDNHYHICLYLDPKEPLN